MKLQLSFFPFVTLFLCFHRHCHCFRQSPSRSIRTFSKTRRYGFLDGILSDLKDRSREATVQHVLVPTKEEATEIYKEISRAGSDSIGSIAKAKSICGSSKKSPDAKLAQLRGAPGELKFRPGQMLPPFEKVAFEAPLGVVQEPFQTREGWHVVVVNQRTGEEKEEISPPLVSKKDKRDTSKKRRGKAKKNTDDKQNSRGFGK
mmetsp:Transcript_14047/g.20755  ORF Transcript_14047/g.20755 Transcript_14047/m.20755 type:complete len:203 (+) Transcript_14047:86-694(+)